MAKQAAGSTVWPGPWSAMHTGRVPRRLVPCHCLEGCQDALAVYHCSTAVVGKLWGHTFDQLAWNKEARCEVKVYKPDDVSTSFGLNETSYH